MRLVIVAATGGIGRQLLGQALAAGHDVTAVVRNPGNVTADVRVVGTDLAHADATALESASTVPTPCSRGSAHAPGPPPG